MERTDQYLREEEADALEQYRKGLASAPLLYRATSLGTKAAGRDEGGLMTFVASEESEDRMGDVLKADGWQLDAFKKNPVFLYVHDQTFPPLGQVSKVEVVGKQLLASVRFDEEDEFATMIRRKYEVGFMRAVSVGFRALEFENRAITENSNASGPGILFKKQELVEVSAVAVPAHPKALRKALGRRSYFWMPYLAEPWLEDKPAPENNAEIDRVLYELHKITEGKGAVK